MQQRNRRLALVGLFLILAGILCGLLPQTEHQAAVTPPPATSAQRQNPNQLPAYSSPARDVYCGSPWVVANYCSDGFGARPQFAILLLALGGLSIGASRVLGQKEDPSR